MNNFQELYKAKCMTPGEAAAFVEDGAICASDISLAQSYPLYEAVAERIRKGELHSVLQHSLLDLQPHAFFDEDLINKSYHSVSWFHGNTSRKAVNKGLMDIMPCYYRDIPGLFRDYIKPSVYIGVVSSMDKHGYFSTGCDGSISEALLDTATTILLEVNPNMPRSLSSPQVHISRVTALCENDKPLLHLPHAEPDELSTTIGNYIAEEIPNGSTIQLGIGAIPEAVGRGLKDKKNLGVHTEMFTDSIVELLKCGAADNTMKPINKGKTVATFCVGSQEMYDFIDDNPAMVIRPVDYVNDPIVIAQHPNFMSINAALEVDFYGQVCAETLGTFSISGTGGQSDFVRGANLSKGGKSFIAFTSTAKDGAVSRIMPTLSTGASVSTSKNDVDCIVTEYGIARLRGRTLGERTKALIAIAHPKFREELLFKARKENILV